MTTPSNTPLLQKGGIALANPNTLDVIRVITLQYNPATLTRTLQPRGTGTGEEGGDISEALRLKGPAAETIKVEAELDAADQLDIGNPIPATLGIQPQLAALESIINPTVEQVMGSMQMEREGFMEILPMESPLSLFIWSRHRILPVRITELSVTEELFDNRLNPIRAKVNLGMRVLTFDDLGISHKGGSVFLDHLIQQAILAEIGSSGSLNKLGVSAGDFA